MLLLFYHDNRLNLKPLQTRHITSTSVVSSAKNKIDPIISFAVANKLSTRRRLFCCCCCCCCCTGTACCCCCSQSCFDTIGDRRCFRARQGLFGDVFVRATYVRQYRWQVLAKLFMIRQGEAGRDASSEELPDNACLIVGTPFVCFTLSCYALLVYYTF